MQQFMDVMLYQTVLLLIYGLGIVIAATDSHHVNKEKLGYHQRLQLSSITNAYHDNNITTVSLVESASCSERQNISCPPCFICATTGKCKCGPDLMDDIRCREETMTSAVLNCHCVTYDELNTKTFVGFCIYNCILAVFNNSILQQGVYYRLPRNISQLNGYMCDRFNRDGVLCGECMKGLSPFVLSYNLSCVNCPNSGMNWLKFIAVGFIPLTLFYFIMVFFNVSVTSSHMNGYVLFSQAVSTPAFVRILFQNIEALPFLSKLIKFVEPFFSSWNLDFFCSTTPDICLNTDTLQAFALDYCVAVYPLVLIVVSYLMIELYDRNVRLIVCIWRPFHFFFKLFHHNWDIQTSVIDSFATFFLLSYVKILSVSTDLLAFTPVIELSSKEVQYRLYYSSNINFFHRYHVPYAILAISFIVFFILTPTLILILYPFWFFQKSLSYCQIRWHFLHAFVDSFQGYYKDGTEPKTWDLRWFSAYGLVLRIGVCFIFFLTLSTMFFVYTIIMLVTAIILLVNLNPYKEAVKHYAVIDAFFMIFLSVLYISFLGVNVVNVQARKPEISFIALSLFVITVPVLYISAITLHWIYSRRKWGKKLLLSIKFRVLSR